MRSRDALQALEGLLKRYSSNVPIGMGSVLDVQTAKKVVGAKFLVSPICRVVLTASFALR